MNIKDYLKRNGMTLILLVGMIILYLCIPSQIAENMVAKATISPRFFPTFSVLGVIVCCALLLVFDAKEHKSSSDFIFDYRLPQKTKSEELFASSRNLSPVRKDKRLFKSNIEDIGDLL